MHRQWFSLTHSARSIACTSLAALCLLALSVPASARDTKGAYADAVRQYKDGRLADAFGRFVALANNGDADAARIALFMHKFGPALYGRYWDLAPHEAESWTSLVNSQKGRVELPTQTSLVPDRVVKRSPTARPARDANSPVGGAKAR